MNPIFPFFSFRQSIISLLIFRQAIGNSHPELLSKCSNGILSEPLNVTDEALYKFVYDLYDEVTVVFTDDYIHLGGDEGNFMLRLERYACITQTSNTAFFISPF
jgi:hypothetical protein